MRSYDGQMLLQFLLNNAYQFEVLQRGQKLLSITVKSGLNIRCIDSLNFIPAKLEDFPTIFDVRLDEKSQKLAKSFWSDEFAAAFL